MFAAAYVYRIKMDSTARTERVLKLHAEIREQRDAIAVLRSEWAKLDSPLRLQGLAERHLPLKPLNANQYDDLKNLPERPPSLVKPGDPDPIGAMINTIEAVADALDCHRFGAAAGGQAMTGAGADKRKPTEPWRQRLIRSLLYGRNVDRAAKARARVGFAILAFAAVYAVIGGRLVMFAIGADGHSARRAAAQDAIATARPDIVDRNGEILATDVKAPSLFGEPRRIIDKDEAIELLTATLPDLDVGEVRDRLSSNKGFVWLKREITPKQQQDIHRLGIPGIGFLRENKRVYPTGNEVAHLIGLVNIDNQGIAGMEKWLDNNGLADLHRAGFATDRLQRPIELSVDLRVEHALRDELLKAKEKFHAKAASGLVTNVKTGEIVAMVSVPDFDPNNPKEAHDPDRINRLTTGVYEMGSTFKAFTLAMALDTGKYDLNSMWDARGPLHYGKFTIHDDEPKGRFLNMKEVFTFSSNVGAARIALSQGVEAHKAFLRKMGQLDRLRTELPESAIAAGAEALERAEHHHHRVRPRHGGGAAAGGDGRQRAGQWRLPDSADLPEAHRGGGDGDRQARDQAGNLRKDAVPDAAQRRDRHRAQGRRQGLLYRRQDRHGREGHQRPLCQEARAHRLHRDHSGRQAALPAPDHAGRAAGVEGNLWLHHLGLERGADGRQCDRPDRAAFGHRAALRSAAARPPYSCGIEATQ